MKTEKGEKGKKSEESGKSENGVIPVAHSFTIHLNEKGPSKGSALLTPEPDLSR